MSSLENKKLLANTKTAIDQGINELLKDKESFPSFEKIDYNKKCTEFTVYCDKALYNEVQSFSAIGLYFYGNYYQA